MNTDVGKGLVGLMHTAVSYALATCFLGRRVSAFRVQTSSNSLCVYPPAPARQALELPSTQRGGRRSAGGLLGVGEVGFELRPSGSGTLR